MRSFRVVIVSAASVLILALGPAAPRTTASGPLVGVQVALPKPPTSYSLPRNAVTVRNGTGLRRALSSHRSRDIILRDGTYLGDHPFDDAGGNRLYAKHLGKAVLEAGLILGGNSGPGGGLVRGVRFDVDSESKTLQGSIIHVWGTGRNSRILDVTLEGHMVISAGIMAREVNGLVIKRVSAKHFKGWGVFVDMNVLGAQVASPPLVEDVSSSYVSWPVPQASNGTQEACVWIGNTAVVRRIDVHDCAWEGLWAGTASKSSLFEDIYSHDSGIGVYFEHYNTDSTLRRLKVTNARIGVMCEWADPAWGYIPGCTNMLIEQADLDTRLAGIVMDEGTKGTTIRSSFFRNQCWAGIGNYKGIGNLWDTSGDDFSRMKPGALPVSEEHVYNAKCG